VNKTISYLAFSNISNVNKSFNLAYFKKIGQLELVNGERKKYLAVTNSQIFDVANDIFKEENSNTLYYKAKKWIEQ